jgi:hypothetical protein
MPKGSQSHHTPSLAAIRADGAGASADGAGASADGSGAAEPTGLTRAQLEAQLASARARRCWWAEDAIRADLRALDRGLR